MFSDCWASIFNILSIVIYFTHVRFLGWTQCVTYTFPNLRVYGFLCYFFQTLYCFCLSTCPGLLKQILHREEVGFRHGVQVLVTVTLVDHTGRRLPRTVSDFSKKKSFTPLWPLWKRHLLWISPQLLSVDIQVEYFQKNLQPNIIFIIIVNGNCLQVYQIKDWNDLRYVSFASSYICIWWSYEIILLHVFLLCQIDK